MCNGLPYPIRRVPTVVRLLLLRLMLATEMPMALCLLEMLVPLVRLRAD